MTTDVYQVCASHGQEMEAEGPSIGPPCQVPASYPWKSTNENYNHLTSSLSSLLLYFTHNLPFIIYIQNIKNFERYLP